MPITDREKNLISIRKNWKRLSAKEKSQAITSHLKKYMTPTIQEKDEAQGKMIELFDGGLF